MELPAAEWMALGAGGRFAALLDAIDQAFPGATADPARLPPEPPWLFEVVLAALENAGRFEPARRFLAAVPATRIAGPVRSSLDRRLAEKARVLAPLQTLLATPGRVTTIQGPRDELVDGFRVRFHQAGERVDVGLCTAALTRMRDKLARPRHLGLAAPELTVEIHGARRTFAARAAELRGEALPAHVQGLAALAGRVLLVHHVTAPWEDPHALFVRLRHEYVHAALRSPQVGRPPPYWLDEGLAIALTMELPNHLVRLWERASSAALPLAELTQGPPSIPRLRDLALAQSALAARRLLQELGAAGVGERLRDGLSDRAWAAHPALRGLGGAG